MRSSLRRPRRKKEGDPRRRPEPTTGLARHQKHQKVGNSASALLGNFTSALTAIKSLRLRVRSSASSGFLQTTSRSPGNASTATGRPSASHSSPNSICGSPVLPSREQPCSASGQMRRKRTIGGGRLALRCVLHQAALVASIHNTDLKVFAGRLRKEGKPHKVVAAAVARKLVVIANALCKSRESWAAKTG